MYKDYCSITCDKVASFFRHNKISTIQLKSTRLLIKLKEFSFHFLDKRKLIGNRKTEIISSNISENNICKKSFLIFFNWIFSKIIVIESVLTSKPLINQFLSYFFKPEDVVFFSRLYCGFCSVWWSYFRFLWEIVKMAFKGRD